MLSETHLFYFDRIPNFAMFHFCTGVLTRKIANVEARQCAIQKSFNDIKDELRLRGDSPRGFLASSFPFPKVTNEEEYANFLKTIERPDERRQIVSFCLFIYFSRCYDNLSLC